MLEIIFFSKKLFTKLLFQIFLSHKKYYFNFKYNYFYLNTNIFYSFKIVKLSNYFYLFLLFFKIKIIKIN